MAIIMESGNSEYLSVYITSLTERASVNDQYEVNTFCVTVGLKRCTAVTSKQITYSRSIHISYKLRLNIHIKKLTSPHVQSFSLEPETFNDIVWNHMYFDMVEKSYRRRLVIIIQRRLQNDR